MPRALTLLAISMCILAAALLVGVAVAAPAQAAGAITGTVVDQWDGPLLGIPVVVYTWDGTNAPVLYGQAPTNAAGVYNIGGCADGDYYVAFNDGAGATASDPLFMPKWYHNAGWPWIGNADVVTVAGADETGIDAWLDGASSISGTVQNESAEPLQFVTVHAYVSDGVGNWWSYRHTTTDVAGNYTLWPLEVGTSYRVEFNDETNAYFAQWWDNKATLAAANTVFVPSTTPIVGRDATLTSVADTLEVTAPTGTDVEHVQGSSMTVSWTTGTSAVGEFRVWIENQGAPWGINTPKVVTAGGGTHFSTSVTLTAPVTPGSAYHAYVQYRATPKDEWTGDWSAFIAESPGTFLLIDPTVVVTVTDPPLLVGATYPVNSTLPVSWTTSVPVSSGTFNIYARTGNSWYFLDQWVPATGDSTYTEDVNLDLYTGSGYQVVVAYDPTGGGVDPSSAWSWGTAPQVFSVTPRLSINVTAPATAVSVAAGGNLTVSWTPVAAPTQGRFIIYARNAASTEWYDLGTYPVIGAALSYTEVVPLAAAAPAVPAGSGYKIVVAYQRVAPSPFWNSWATSPGSFTVTAETQSIAVSEPSGTGSYEPGDDVTITFKPTPIADFNVGMASFRFWVRSSSGSNWYWIADQAIIPGVSTYSFDEALPALPNGSGYRIWVAWSSTSAAPWLFGAYSPGSFSYTN